MVVTTPLPYSMAMRFVLGPRDASRPLLGRLYPLGRRRAGGPSPSGLTIASPGPAGARRPLFRTGRRPGVWHSSGRYWLRSVLQPKTPHLSGLPLIFSDNLTAAGPTLPARSAVWVFRYIAWLFSCFGDVP